MSGLVLYHYTCEHGYKGLGEAGTLHTIADRAPNRVQDLERLGTPDLAYLIWATDLEVPRRYALGLTSVLLHCDRTQYRYRVLEPDQFVAWPTARKDWPSLARRLEVGRARPLHWWVTAEPADVVLAMP
jgi:hypothetical protein